MGEVKSEVCNVQDDIDQTKTAGDNLVKTKFHVKVDRNGGGSALILEKNDIEDLKIGDVADVVETFLCELFRESSPCSTAKYCIGIVRGGCFDLPDLLKVMTDLYPSMVIKSHAINDRNDLKSMKINDYMNHVKNNASHGIFKYGPLLPLSLAGAKNEECGGYLKEILEILERNPILTNNLPWSKNSKLNLKTREESDDGPILWTRPGEQLVPCNDYAASPSKKRNLSTRSRMSRETAFFDRTYPHADFSNYGNGLEATAAVGIVQSVCQGYITDYNSSRKVKDVLCFDPSNFSFLCDELQIDTFEPPATQSNQFIDRMRLNSLSIKGVKYIQTSLRSGDIYFIPRKVVHQFLSASAVTSVAWHLHWKDY